MPYVTLLKEHAAHTERKINRNYLKVYWQDHEEEKSKQHHVKSVEAQISNSTMSH